MTRTSLQLAALAVGIIAAISSCEIWRHEPKAKPLVDQKKIPAATPRSARPIAPPAAAQSPAELAMRTLLAQLEAVLREGDARARESLLTFRDDAALQDFLRRADRSGLIVLGRLPGLRTVRVRHNTFSSLQDEVLGHANDYADLSANYLVGIPGIPAKENRAARDNVPFGNRTLEYLGATGDDQARAGWGRGITIAIVDSGVSGDATFGVGRLSALDIGLGIAPATTRESGHGTAIAALAAGMAPDAAGVAPAANLLSIRVTDENGVSDLFTVSNAIVAAVNAGAKIVNVSLGGYATAPVLSAALDYASSRGVVVVAAAGNDQAAQLAWPAADSRVVSVGASDAAEQQVTFSNSSQQLQIAAPGYGVQSAWLDGQRVTVDGTSASAPLVSGAIAAVMSQYPGLSAPEAAQRVIQTAGEAGIPGPDTAFGHGILNLDWAMNYNRASYVDTAVASHFYDPTSNQMQFVIENRSGRAVSGLVLKVTSGSEGGSYTVPSLGPGEHYIAKMPVNETALKAAGSLPFSTQLINPPGLSDAVPANNLKSSVLNGPPSM